MTAFCVTPILFTLGFDECPTMCAPVMIRRNMALHSKVTLFKY